MDIDEAVDNERRKYEAQRVIAVVNGEDTQAIIFGSKRDAISEVLTIIRKLAKESEE